jgi:hypothetical protein
MAMANGNGNGNDNGNGNGDGDGKWQWQECNSGLSFPHSAARITYPIQLSENLTKNDY